METDLEEVKSHLAQLTHLVGQGGAELMRQVNLLKGKLQDQGQNMQEVETLLTTLMGSEHSSQKKWGDLETWASRIQSSVSTLMGERAPIFQTLEALRSQINNMAQANEVCQSWLLHLDSLFKKLESQNNALQGWKDFSQQKMAQMESNWNEWEVSQATSSLQLTNTVERLHTKCKEWWLEWEAQRSALSNLQQQSSLWNRYAEQMATHDLTLGTLSSQQEENAHALRMMRQDNAQMRSQFQSDIQALSIQNSSPTVGSLDATSQIFLQQIG
jgi:chromosome segregation ATPase